MAEQLVTNHNLPHLTTSFVGRQSEITEIANLLESHTCQLLTLVGPGGAGKTRLAIEVARHQMQHFPDGVFFVPLAPLTSADQIPAAIANGLQIQPGSGASLKDEVLYFLRDTQLLLVLDNFEHVLPGADLIGEILAATSQVKVLVTSRSILNMQAEWVHPVQGMRYPGDPSQDLESFSAVRLFAERAQRVRPDFSLVKSGSCAVRICQLVEGMPLALELAAAWMKTISCDLIADQIQRDLDFLASSQRDIPERHQSIRAVFDHSWNLLTPQEQQVFQRFSVFRGGCTLQAAEAVAGATLPMVNSLVEKSLLTLEPSGRYGLHELLRQYGEEKLAASGEMEATRDAHSVYYCRFMGEREADIKGRRQLAAVNEINADFENFILAWQRGLARKNYQALDQALETLLHFTEIRGRFRGAKELVLSAQKQIATESAQELRAILERIRVRGIWMSRWGESRPDRIAAIGYEAEECLATARQQGDKAHLAFCLWLMGTLNFLAEEYARGMPFLEESLALFTDLDDHFYMARAADWLGAVVGFCGQIERFARLTQQSLDLRRAIGDRFGVTASLTNLERWSIESGQYDQAKRYNQEISDIYQEIGGAVWQAKINANLSWIAFQQGEFQKAQTLAEAVLALFSMNSTYMVVDERLLAHSILGMLAALEEDYARCWELCQPVRLDPGGPIPTSEEGLAVSACGLGDYPTARHYFLKSLNIAAQGFDYRGMTAMLPVAAILLNQEGQIEQAVEMLGLAFHHPASAKTWMEQWPLLTRLRAKLEAKLGAERFSAAWEHGETLDLDAAIAVLLSRFLMDNDVQQQANQALNDPLTLRELEVLNLIYTGSSNREIAAHFVVAESTIKRHINHIYSKLAVENRAEAITRARELGLLR